MPCKSSGIVSADGAITSAPAVLHSVTLIPDASNAASVILYDCTSASGTVLAKMSALANTGSHTEEFHCQAAYGIYADVTGGGMNLIVHYTPGWGES